MLTANGYAVAMLAYVASAMLALFLGNLWLLPRAGFGLRALLTLPLAGLLLTPAYIEAGADTLAPALIVTAFQVLSAGPEAAAHALAPLMVFTAVGLAFGLILFLLALWRRARAAGRDSGPEPTA